MRHKLKKFMKSMFAVGMTITSLFGNQVTPIHADGYVLTVTTPYGVNMSPGDKWAIGTNTNAYGYDVYAPLYINGTKVYCVQQNVLTVDGAGDYSPEALGTYTGSAAMTRKLEYISSLGYGFEGDTSQEMDFATQIRIWQEMGLGSVTNIHPDIQAKIDIINARLNVMYSNVSFNNQTITLQGYGEEFAQTVTDTNGVLSYYKDYDVSGIHSSRNGNTLKVWAEEGDSLNASLKYDCYYMRYQTGTSIAYTSGSSQNVAFMAGIDPTNALVNVKVELGSIQLTKTDFERASDPQGDATFEGAIFDVIDNKTNLSVGLLVSDANGTTNIIDKLPTDRTYSIKEDTPPTGYNLSSESQTVDFSKVAGENLKEYTSNFDDNVITGRMDLRKVITDGQQSEITKPEVNAEFIVMLKKYVDEYGSIQEAYNHISEMSEREYDYLVTDKNGNAATKDLAYGTYMVQQVKGEDETDLLKSAFTFEIDEQDKHFEYTINNRPSDYYIKLVKVDSKTGEVVSLNSASFKIKDSKGNYVTMKVGSKTYDTFTTTSDNGLGVLESVFGGSYYSKEEDKGTVITPVKLKAGSYTIEEVKTPTGFLTTDPVHFTVAKNYVTDSDADEDFYVTIEVENEQPTGTLSIKKSVEDFKDADVSLVDREDLSGYRFTLYAKENVISAIDGNVIYEKGTKVGTYTTDKKGEIHVTEIPLGKYVLKETSAVNGTIASKEEWDVEFTQKDEITKVYTIDEDVENKTTKVEFSKKSVTGQDELEGAHIVVKDSDGNIVDQWDSGKETHIIEGLIAGNKYTMEETIAPNGFAKATSIEFTVNNDGTVQHVDMVDKKVTVSKQDVGGDEVIGATITVTDKDGNIVDEWVSNDKPHDVNGLEVGETYTLTETIVPRGFVKVSELTFTVKDDGIDEYFELVDTIETIAKVDQKNNVVLGATLQIIDDQGIIVDEWTTGSNVLETFGASLQTEMKATGIKVNTSSVKDGTVTEKEIFTLIVTDSTQTDETKKWSYYYVDADGNELLHRASNLEAGCSYTLHEVNAPENYLVSEDVTFIAPKDADETVTMIDTKTDKVSITKYAATGKKELPGAELKVLDKDGKEIDKWTSTKEEHFVEGLIVGEEYTLVEITAPKGYRKAELIKFVVEDNGEVVQKVEMYDKEEKGPNTGIANNTSMYFTLAGVSALGLALLTFKKKFSK